MNTGTIKQIVGFFVFLGAFPFTASAIVYAPIPTLSESTEGVFVDDPTSPGVHPNTGTTTETFTFKTIYSSPIYNYPPTVLSVVIGNGTATSSYPMVLDTGTVSSILKDGNYVNGEQYIYQGVFPAGNYRYHFITDYNVNFPEGTWLTTEAGDEYFLPNDWHFTVTLSSGCITDCYSNVLFLPGLEASRLYRPDYNGGTDQLWEPTSSSDGEDLALDLSGRSLRNDIYTKDVIDTAYYGGPKVYGSFIDSMNNLKSAGTITDWKATPYDWRLSLEDILASGKELSGGRIYYSSNPIATSSPYILQELRRLAQTSKTGKVTIVAHSNGGLVAKALTEKLDTEASSLIDKIIFVAVPQVGTPQAIGALLHGYEQGLPKDWLSFFFAPSAARTLAQNMPSSYNLLPSENYFTYTDNNVVTFDSSDFLAPWRARYGGDKIHSSEMLKNFITDTWRLASSSPSDLIYPSVGNVTLLAQAEALHATLDNWTPPQGVQLYEIAGWGEDTLETIEYKKGKKTVCSSPSASTCPYYITVPVLSYSPKEVIDGDGTVVVSSALWTPAASTKGRWWVDLRKYNGRFGLTKHADILEVSGLRTLVKDILTNSTSTLPTYISTIQAIANPADTRLRFILHSPLNLSATDNLGNIISSATSTIPGSRFTRYGEVQVLKVPKGTPIILNLYGYATGSFTLDMQELDGLNNIIASSTISAVPSATSTTATISFTDGTLQSASPLAVDYDNNGTTDFIINPKLGEETIFDIIPPEARISFSITTKSLVIEGIDESSTTLRTTATSTTITDQTGNTTQLLFSKLNQEKHEIKLELSSISYNNTPTTTPKTTLQYEWSTDKQGNLRELEQKAIIGNSKIEAHYDVRKNITKIEKKSKDKDGNDEHEEIKETFLGLRILKLVTGKGSVSIDY